ncbi:MAG: hypothetical protein AAB624_02440 [Patescibacteria group bacterium]
MGAQNNEELFNAAARGSIVANFTVARRAPDLIVASVATGIIGRGHSVGYTESDLGFEEPELLLHVLRGWRVSFNNYVGPGAAILGPRNIAYGVDVRAQDKGIPVVNPCLLGSDNEKDHVVRLLNPSIPEYAVTVAGQEHVVEMISKLEERGARGHVICTELARFAEIGVVLCNNPQIVEKTEE